MRYQSSSALTCKRSCREVIYSRVFSRSVQVAGGALRNLPDIQFVSGYSTSDLGKLEYAHTSTSSRTEKCLPMGALASSARVTLYQS
jgi:hypothetical protein